MGFWDAVASAGPYANTLQLRQITTPTPHHSIFYRPDALLSVKAQKDKVYLHQSITVLLTGIKFCKSSHSQRYNTVARTLGKYLSRRASEP